MHVLFSLKKFNTKDHIIIKQQNQQSFLFKNILHRWRL